MSNKWLKVSAVVVLVAFVVGACGSTATPATTNPQGTQAPAAIATTAQSTAIVKVALLLTGPITDGGWDQEAYDGLEQLKSEKGFQVAYTENITQDKITETTTGYADDGYNLIIVHGFEYGSAFLDIAPKYPNQMFFVSSFKPQPNIPKNLMFADLAYYQAAYGAGALAALMSTKHIVGFVGGGDNPTQQNMMKAFEYAAKQTVSGTNGLGVVTGDYNDASKGREAALTMIGNGADVIWHAADVTGLGAIEGAVEGKALVLGCYSDQTNLAPSSMGTSFVMDLGGMVVTLGHDVQNGTFAGGTEWDPSVKQMWKLQAVDFDHNSSVIPDATWTKFLQIWSDLDTGKIKVSAAIQ
jgi:basic membrane protein A